MSSFDKKSINIRSQRNYQVSYHEQGTKGSTYRCQACLQRGCGPYYSRKSEGHKLYYHQFCGELLSSESSSAASVGKHPLYPTVDLVLQATEPRKVRPCVVCGDEVQMLRYEWWHKKEQGSRNTCDAFHPLCASLLAQIGGSHEHGIVLQLEERIRGECVICKGDSINSKGWAYNNITGNYCCHVRCMKENMERLPKKEASRKKEASLSREKEAPRKNEEKEALRKKEEKEAPRRKEKEAPLSQKKEEKEAPRRKEKEKEAPLSREKEAPQKKEEKEAPRRKEKEAPLSQKKEKEAPRKKEKEAPLSREKEAPPKKEEKEAPRRKEKEAPLSRKKEKEAPLSREKEKKEAPRKKEKEAPLSREKEAPRTKEEKKALRKKEASPENKGTIYVKKASPPVLKTAAKVALQLIAVALFGTPHIANLIIGLLGYFIRA